MPELQNYTAKIGALPQVGGRRATADDFGAQIGQGLASAGKAMNSVVEDIEGQESRTAVVASSQIRAKYARLLDEASTSGAGTGKLREQMNEELGKIGENFGTSRGVDTLDSQIANTNLAFDNESNAINVRRAGAEAALDANKFLTSTASLMQNNPAYLAQAEADANAFVSTLTRVPPEKRAEIGDKLRNELNVAAVNAAIRIDPQAAKRDIAAGDWYLTPAQRTQAEAHAEQAIRAERADEQYAIARREKEQNDAADAARDEHFAKIIDGTATQQDIMSEPRFAAKPELREHMIMLKESRAKELATREKASNPAVVNDLWLRINAPEGDPRKTYNADLIFQAVENGQINTTDANKLNALVAGQKDENGRSFQTRLYGRITTISAAMRSSPQYAAQPELAAAIQNQMIAEVEQKSAEMRKKNESPDALLDPGSKDYYFTPDRIKRVADDVQRAGREAGLGGPKPGEVVYKDGVAYQFRGGNPADARNWEFSTGGKPAVEQIPGNAPNAPLKIETTAPATGGSLSDQYLQAIADWEKLPTGSPEEKAAKKKVDELRARREKGEK